ncbi:MULTISPECIES: chorismate mutase [unclassified Pseudonocardia]|uniref:chorismate mutase n=1 Tax=unclassified Pseudonocardia TaxID=2619320 RepID=UPI0001FFF215|nr:chorismate mutase [Pseudonocardia sp. Ae707_Ps1]
MSLDEVRMAIDRIDDEMVTLLARRQRYVREAASYKRDEEAVRASDRRQALMTRLHERARAEQLAPEVVDATWSAMIDAFIQLELNEHQRG